MNLLNTAICETKEGDLLIVWGGRRIVTQCLTPPIVEGGGEPGVESVYKRRYRWDNGNMIITRIYDNYSKRIDYVGPFGRNPAIIKDVTGRIWIGYRIPVISSQDPMGALSREYVVPQNIGTTAGMNFWTVLRSYDLSLLTGAYPFDWQEQVGIPINYLDTELPAEGEGLEELYSTLAELEGMEGIGDTTMEMYTDFTENVLTGILMLRGKGGNEMDVNNPDRWKWNENEGLGRSYSSAIIDISGRQVRTDLSNHIIASDRDTWIAYKTLKAIAENFGITANVRVDRWNNLIVAGYKEEYGEIPYVVEIDGKVTEKVDSAVQAEWESLWATDNEREWIYENAKVPAEGYFSWEEPPTPEEQAAITASLTKYYYELPTLNKQRPGLAVSKTGLIFLTWMHGNQIIIPVNEANKEYKAVGMRMAVSRDNGKTFEPLIPDRVGYLHGVN